MVHPKTRLINHKPADAPGEHPYKLIAIRLLESLNSYVKVDFWIINVNYGNFSANIFGE